MSFHYHLKWKSYLNPVPSVLSLCTTQLMLVLLIWSQTTAEIAFTENMANSSIGQHIYGSSTRQAECDISHLIMTKKNVKPYTNCDTSTYDHANFTFNPSLNDMSLVSGEVSYVEPAWTILAWQLALLSALDAISHIDNLSLLLAFAALVSYLGCSSLHSISESLKDISIGSNILYC